MNGFDLSAVDSIFYDEGYDAMDRFVNKLRVDLQKAITAENLECTLAKKRTFTITVMISSGMGTYGLNIESHCDLKENKVRAYLVVLKDKEFDYFLTSSEIGYGHSNICKFDNVQAIINELKRIKELITCGKLDSIHKEYRRVNMLDTFPPLVRSASEQAVGLERPKLVRSNSEGNARAKGKKKLIVRDE